MRKQQYVARALALVVTLTVGAAYAVGPAGAPSGKGPHGHDKDKDHDPDRDRDKDRHRDKDQDHPMGSEGGHGPGHHGMRGLIEELKSGKLKKADVKERLGKLHDQRDERMKQHREELRARFGATLASAAAREELEHHARRMAKLDRAMVLCETEVTKDKDKLTDRVQKLIDKENQRHERAMERLKSMPPTPPRPAASAAPAAPPAASAAVKAGDK